MTASITAFLYAGALQAEQASGKLQKPDETNFEAYNGHTGFVRFAEIYATPIAQWLAERTDDDDPGVMEYELIEPLGEWLIVQPEPPATEAVVARFTAEYLKWIEGADEHGISPRDTVVTHDGTVIQVGEKPAEAERPADVERTIETKSYEITLDLHGEHRGYFEHKIHGDNRAGGLWYDENKNLRDYDGVAELPKQVREALIADGFTSTEGCLDE